MFVVVGVTGGIAAYKTVHLVRALVTNGHEVHVVPTEDSLRFVGTTTWEAVSRNPVTTSVHDDVARAPRPRHLRRPRRHRPGDRQHAREDGRGHRGRPARRHAARHHRARRRRPRDAHRDVGARGHAGQHRHLRARGVHVVGPADGPLTGGDSGPGRMVEPEEIVARRWPSPPRVRRISRAARRRVDRRHARADRPVRFLGNRSSGRQGPSSPSPPPTAAPRSCSWRRTSTTGARRGIPPRASPWCASGRPPSCRRR
jgi:phosphopantothenoylcysteine decarboxylase/phosphopantothenate--cysteine ligase